MTAYVGLAKSMNMRVIYKPYLYSVYRTLPIQCIYGVFGRESTKYTVV